MNTELRNSDVGRLLYNQLRLAIVYPGETVADMRRKYEAVDKTDWTFDYAMTQPDTPMVTYHRARERRMWLTWKVA